MGLMCRPQAEAIYGTEKADEMEEAGVFDNCDPRRLQESTNPFAITILENLAKEDEIVGSFDTLMCRPQAEAIYGTEKSDEMEAAGVFGHCVADAEGPVGTNAACEFGVCLWGDASVPYYVNGDSDLALIVDLSARELETRSNARFTRILRPTGSYIEVVNSSQCGGVSNLGKSYNGGSQKLEAPTAGNCGSTDTAVSVTVHEMMHALGLFHEQTRPDRDDYITVNFDNIQQGTRNFNYEKRGQQKVDALKLPYDYQSIILYGSDTFGNGNGPTMVAKNGQFLGGSKLTDVDK